MKIACPNDNRITIIDLGLLVALDRHRVIGRAPGHQLHRI